MKQILTIAILLLSCSPALSECIGSFEKLLSQIEVDDRVLSENTKSNYYIEELLVDSNGNLIEQRKLESIPDKYKYGGRIYPSQSQQEELGISLRVRPVLLKHVRVVTEKTSDGTELSNSWFWQYDGCWKLRSRAINIKQ